MNFQHLSLPFRKDELLHLKAGDCLLLSGTLYSARDEAHKRLCELKHASLPLPVDLKNQVLYYVGPAPSRPGQTINSAGPTTAKRMDSYSSDMIDLGVIGMIGKGERSVSTRNLLKGKCLYMAALGGVSAKIAKCIVKQEIVAFEDSGMEAMRRMEVRDFPVVVINDLEGRDYYEEIRS